MELLAYLGEAAKHVASIIALCTAVAAIIFSPRLWRSAKRGVSNLKLFFRGVNTIGELVPTLEALPSTLEKTNDRIAGLETSLSERVNHWVTADKQLAELVERVKRIDAQLNPDNGSSLHDTVNIIRRELGDVQRDVHTVAGVLRISWDALGNFGVFYTDSEGNNTYTSAVYLKWINRTEGEMIGRGWINALYPADRAAVLAEWGSCLADERDFTMRYRLMNKGTPFEVVCTASPLRDKASEQVIMWVGVLRKAGIGEES